MTSTIQMTATPNEIIIELTGLVDGELTSRSRVVDGLLDLRNASSSDAFQARIDELLAGIPGLNTVPNGWWLDRLTELSELNS
jgi:hypothetical protein